MESLLTRAATDTSMQNMKSLESLTWQKLTEDPGQ
jgi:hypothetical protein